MQGCIHNMGKIRCEICKKKCIGDVIRADDKHFHVACFTCKACRRGLGDVGYFVHDGDYYCPSDYFNKFGKKCPTCNQFVEGEVVELMGKTYHQQCFRCDRCRKPFPTGQKVTYDGKLALCEKCAVTIVKPTQTSPEKQQQLQQVQQEPASGSPPGLGSPSACAACNQMIHSGQVLLALDAQWHIWCFKCNICGSVLHGEYMAKDGFPYCIRDYNYHFGVKCDECGKFIAGRVLQAGNYHFHPGCARCSRCALHFEDGEEMYMQGDEIWHPRCNDTKAPEKIVHTLPRSPRSSFAPKYTLDFGKHLTYMYLLPEPNSGYLKQPISPHPPATQQFHTPQGPVKIRKSRISMFKSGMQKLAEALEEHTPRPHSPHMNNEEPIELSHYPSAKLPDPGAVPPIERDDFPAPPYPYAVEELKRRLSTSDVEDDEEEQVDKAAEKINKAEAELKKYENESSIAKVVVHDLMENAKKGKAPLFWDPRSASRTASAKKMPHLKCRYESPINASPSRYMNRPRPWEYWDKERAATATIPYMRTPKPGYGLAPKAATLPGPAADGYFELHYGDLDVTRSSGFSDRSLDGTPSFIYDRHQPYPPIVLRSSLPDMSKPPKTYPYSQITTTNKKLPEDVDRCHLERHLSKDEFERLFGMTPIEFYKLPPWKRINMKRKARLF